MKRLNSISISKPDLVFLVLFFVYNYVAILNDSLLSVEAVIRPLKYVVIIAGILLFPYRQKSGLSVRKLIFAAVILGAFVLAAKATGRKYLIVYGVFIVMSDGCEPDHAVKDWLISTVAALATILILCAVGVLPDYIFRYESGRACHCLGFIYYSFFPFLVFLCSVAFIYLKKDAVRFYHYVLVALVNVLMYRLSTLRLTFLLTFFFIILDCLLMKLKRLDLNRKSFMIFSFLLYPLGTVVTYFMMANFNPADAGWASLNGILHDRPILMHEGYLRYSVTLFGTRFDMLGNGALWTVPEGQYFYIDSGFAYSLLGYGLIFTFVAVLLYSVIYVYSCRTNNKHLFAWLSCVLLFTMMNNIWVDVPYNPALLFSFAALTELSGVRGGGRQASAPEGSPKSEEPQATDT